MKLKEAGSGRGQMVIGSSNEGARRVMNKRFRQRMALRATNTRVATDGTFDLSWTRVGAHWRAVLVALAASVADSRLSPRGDEHRTPSSPTPHAGPRPLG